VSTGFNAAVVGAVFQDLLGQAEWLVQQLKAAPLDFNLDWKVLTIWIGSNNLCDVCNDENSNSAANYEAHVASALQYLYDNVPRVFVNLVAPLDVASLWNLPGVYCTTIHAVACPCAGSFFSSDRAIVSQATKDYAARSYSLAQRFRKKDFAVVVQPFLEQVVINDRSLVSEADCFHPSAKGHAMGAVGLWNNMLTPASRKKKTWNENDLPICPTNDDKFYTN